MILPTTTAWEEGEQLSSSDERREEEVSVEALKNKIK
jgi:hypothetical protein